MGGTSTIAPLIKRLQLCDVLQGQKIAPKSLRHWLSSKITSTDAIQHHFSILQPPPEESFLTLGSNRDKPSRLGEDVAQVSRNEAVNELRILSLEVLRCTTPGWYCRRVNAALRIF